MERLRNWHTPAAAQALVPVPGCASTAVVHDGLVFVSAISGSHVSLADSPAAEMRDALRQLTIVLRASRSSPADVLQLTFALKRAEDISALDLIMPEFFQAPYPARVTVGAPLGAPITVSAIAACAADVERRPDGDTRMRETLI